MITSEKNKKVRSIVQMLKDKGVPSFFSTSDEVTDVSPSGTAEATENTSLGDLISNLDKDKVDKFYEGGPFKRREKEEDEPEPEPEPKKKSRFLVS